MIAVIYGGRSCEHNISVITGVMAYKAIESEAIAVYIDDKGVWWTGKTLGDMSVYKNFCGRNFKRVHIRPASDKLYYDNGKKVCKIDAALICCHGMDGEDGTLQGLLELSRIPYTGSNVCASALSMDKVAMKQIFEACGIPCVKYMGLYRHEYDSGLYDFVSKLKEEFKFPLIVKPANLGSSIGIGIAHEWRELFDKIRVAFEWDNRVIIEEALENFTEVNCAVLGSRSESETSLTEQPIGWKEFLKYEDKYEGKQKGRAKVCPADIPENVSLEVKRLAKATFDAVGAAGVARIDFMIKDGEVLVNEINTIPGSLAFYLFKDKYDLSALIHRMIEIAKKQTAEKNSLKFTYKSQFSAKRK